MFKIEKLKVVVETLEILGDQQLSKSIRQGIKEIETGEGIPWDEAKLTLER